MKRRTDPLTCRDGTNAWTHPASSINSRTSTWAFRMTRKTATTTDGSHTKALAGFANLLSADDAQGPPLSVTPSPASTAAPLPESADGDRKSKGKNKRRKKGKRKPSKWADKCMYAELLELHDSPLWTTGYGTQGVEQSEDGLPSDLESGWVALAPVPVGKRCLAVSMQSAGLSGIGKLYLFHEFTRYLKYAEAPNTMLRSRLLGKVLLPPFPSPLPSNTILDCILTNAGSRPVSFMC